MPKNNETRDSQEVFPAAFRQSLENIGGLNNWRNYGTLFFSEVRAQDTIKYTVDLKNRDERIEKPGHYTVDFIGDSVQIFPNRDSFAKKPQFYHNLKFYFFALPYVTADPGTIHEDLGSKMFDGKLYDRIKVTFEDSVGLAPKDQYILWFDHQDHLLRLLNYSVTYFDENNAEKYNAIIYDGWKGFDGLKFPTQLTGYIWEADTLGAQRYQSLFTDISLSTDRKLNRSSD